MRLLNYLAVPGAAAALLALTAIAPAGTSDQAGQRPENPTADSGNGAIGATSAPQGQTDGSASAKALHLTDEQRQQIRAALAGEKTELEFEAPEEKPQKDFTPSVGGSVPPQLPAQPMPPKLAEKMPMLANYTYMKIKNQLLIINPMTKKIVDVFPES